jgi:hypothetical protein
MAVAPAIADEWIVTLWQAAFVPLSLLCLALLVWAFLPRRR